MSLATLRTFAMVAFVIMGTITVWQARVRAFGVATMNQAFGCTAVCHDDYCLYGWDDTECSDAEAAARDYCTGATFTGGCFIYTDGYNPPGGCEITNSYLYTSCHY